MIRREEHCCHHLFNLTLVNFFLHIIFELISLFEFKPYHWILLDYFMWDEECNLVNIGSNSLWDCFIDKRFCQIFSKTNLLLEESDILFFSIQESDLVVLTGNCDIQIFLHFFYALSEFLIF